MRRPFSVLLLVLSVVVATALLASATDAGRIRVWSSRGEVSGVRLQLQAADAKNDKNDKDDDAPAATIPDAAKAARAKKEAEAKAAAEAAAKKSVQAGKDVGKKAGDPGKVDQTPTEKNDKTITTERAQEVLDKLAAAKHREAEKADAEEPYRLNIGTEGNYNDVIAAGETMPSWSPEKAPMASLNKIPADKNTFALYLSTEVRPPARVWLQRVFAVVADPSALAVDVVGAQFAMRPVPTFERVERGARPDGDRRIATLPGVHPIEANPQSSVVAPSVPVTLSFACKKAGAFAVRVFLPVVRSAELGPSLGPNSPAPLMPPSAMDSRGLPALPALKKGLIKQYFIAFTKECAGPVESPSGAPPVATDMALASGNINVGTSDTLNDIVVNSKVLPDFDPVRAQKRKLLGLPDKNFVELVIRGQHTRLQPPVVTVHSPHIATVMPQSRLMQGATVLLPAQTYRLTLVFTCRDKGTTGVSVAFNTARFGQATPPVLVTFNKECARADDLTERDTSVPGLFISRDTRGANDVVADGRVTDRYRLRRSALEEKEANRFTIGAAVPNTTFFLALDPSRAKAIVAFADLVAVVEGDDRAVLEPLVKHTLPRNRLYGNSQKDNFTVIYNCRKVGEARVTVKLSLIPAGDVSFTFIKTCAQQSLVKPAKDVFMPGLEMAIHWDKNQPLAPNVVMNGEVDPEFSLKTLSADLVMFDDIAPFVTMYMYLNQSEPGAVNKLAFGQPVLHTQYGVTRPVLSGPAAAGGWLVDEMPAEQQKESSNWLSDMWSSLWGYGGADSDSDSTARATLRTRVMTTAPLTITFNCQRAGVSLVTLAIPLLNASGGAAATAGAGLSASLIASLTKTGVVSASALQRAAASSRRAAAASAPVQHLYITFQKNCSGHDALEAARVSGFNVGSSDGGAEVVKDGQPVADAVEVTAEHNVLPLYLSFKARARRVVGVWPLTFLDPVAVPLNEDGSPTVAVPSLAGTAADGGELARDGKSDELDVMFSCLSEGIQMIKVSIPLGTRGTVTFLVRKTCKEKDVRDGFFVNGLRIGTSAHMYDVVHSGYTLPEFSHRDLTGSGFTHYSVDQDADTTSFFIEYSPSSEGVAALGTHLPYLYAIEPIVYPYNPICNPTIDHSFPYVSDLGNVTSAAALKLIADAGDKAGSPDPGHDTSDEGFLGDRSPATHDETGAPLPSATKSAKEGDDDDDDKSDNDDEDDAEAYKQYIRENTIRIGPEMQTLNVTYDCTAANSTYIAVVIPLIPRGQIMFHWRKDCGEAAQAALPLPQQGNVDDLQHAVESRIKEEPAADFVHIGTIEPTIDTEDSDESVYDVIRNGEVQSEYLLPDLADRERDQSSDHITGHVVKGSEDDSVFWVTLPRTAKKMVTVDPPTVTIMQPQRPASDADKGKDVVGEVKVTPPEGFKLLPTERFQSFTVHWRCVHDGLAEAQVMVRHGATIFHSFRVVKICGSNDRYSWDEPRASSTAAATVVTLLFLAALALLALRFLASRGGLKALGLNFGGLGLGTAASKKKIAYKEVATTGDDDELAPMKRAEEDEAADDAGAGAADASAAVRDPRAVRLEAEKELQRLQASRV